MRQVIATAVRRSGAREPMTFAVDDDAGDGRVEDLAMEAAERLTLACPTDPVDVVILPRLLKEVCCTVELVREEPAP